MTSNMLCVVIRCTGHVRFDRGVTVLFYFSTMVSPIISIIANDKLTRENYVKWKSNMNAILVCEDLKFFLIEDCPPEPARNTGQAVRDTHQK